MRSEKLRDLCLNERLQKRFLWTAFVLTVSAIFILSAQPAEVSTIESDLLVATPLNIFERVHPEKTGDYSVYLVIQFIVRKTAHVIEFSALSVWTSGLLVLYKKRLPYLMAIVFTSLYAVSDEVHQIFIPGREGKIMDWLFDSTGAVLGALFVFFFLRFMKTRIDKQNDSGHGPRVTEE